MPFAASVRGTVSRRALTSRIPSRSACVCAGSAKAEKLIAELKPQIEAVRTYSLGKLSTKPAKADFFVVFTPTNKVEAVKFISGDESLKSATQKIQAINYGPLFPDNTPTQLVRRGTLSCPQSGECSFQLIEPEEVTSVD